MATTARNQRNRVADADRTALDDARPQAAAIDQRPHYGLAYQTFEVLTRRAVLDPLEQHVANTKTLTKEIVQTYAARGQVAAMLAATQGDSVLGSQSIEGLGLEQCDLACAGIGRSLRVEADLLVVSIAEQPFSGDGLNFSQ
jgi:hypothetical protein